MDLEGPDLCFRSLKAKKIEIWRPQKSGSRKKFGWNGLIEWIDPNRFKPNIQSNGIESNRIDWIGPNALSWTETDWNPNRIESDSFFWNCQCLEAYVTLRNKKCWNWQKSFEMPNQEALMVKKWMPNGAWNLVPWDDQNFDHKNLKAWRAQGLEATQKKIKNCLAKKLLKLWEAYVT